MNNKVFNINKIIYSKVRVGLTIISFTNYEVSFNYLTKSLDIIGGNSNTHLDVLEKEKYIIEKKSFIINKTKTKSS